MSQETIRAVRASVERHMKTLLNNDLKVICKSESLSVSGVKATLQARILELLDNAITSGDTTRFYELAQKISPAQGRPATASSASQGYSQSPTSSVPVKSASSSYGNYTNGSYQNMQNSYGPANTPRHQHPRLPLQFTDSPFFKTLENWSEIHQLPAMLANRHSVSITLRLNSTQAERLRSDSSLRIMVWCCADPTFSPAKNDIAFPAQIELKVNDTVYTGNLRGIKKKPGTTRPADITDLLQKYNGQPNNILLTYAGTDKRYMFQINLTKKVSVDDLVKGLQRGRTITKQQVINEMQSKANDPDIVFTSTVMSLKCPISTMRMELPARSLICNHNQCFEAKWFLQLQEQAPQWACPVCNKIVSFQALAIDQYVQDILNKTSKSVEQVTIEPNGEWRAGGNTDDFRTPRGSAKKTPAPTTAAFDDDDDLIEISDHKVNGIKGPDLSSTPASSHRTPLASSREPSVAGSTMTGVSTSSKRKQEVIDLTLDSDEDETPARPIKRQSMSFNGSTPSSASSARPPMPFSMSSFSQSSHNQRPTSAVQSPSTPSYPGAPWYNGSSWKPPGR